MHIYCLIILQAAKRVNDFNDEWNPWDFVLKDSQLSAFPDGDNLLRWIATIEGPDETGFLIFDSMIKSTMDCLSN